MYSGMYNGSKKHEPDIDKVLSRAWNVGLEKIFITAGNLSDVRNSLKLANTNDRLYTTVGVHPTRCSEFDTEFPTPSEYIQNLKQEFDSNIDKIVALGEFGLDYERTKFCDVETQKKYFRLQLEQLGPYTNLPLFLHCRAAATDLHEILSQNLSSFPRGGVVHSFDGSEEEMKNFVQLGLHIGLNGCSLKTEENCKVVKEIPVERILFETDAPWCGIRPSHFSSSFVKTKFPAVKKNYDENMMYKTRNEPHTILNILEIVAHIKGDMDPADLASKVYENTLKLFS
ncbi:putative deoxyribonuclease TATDN1 isoform X2 [Folsomia candida]|nr:putative deoxyribonuclease TATDN1 isoform X2 [Folsomia candida]